MIIKKRPIISWLLDDNYPLKDMGKLSIADTGNPLHLKYLSNGFESLRQIRDYKPNWGLPELLMPSFEHVMQKSAKSFYNIDHQLFQEFYNDEVCGILLHKIYGTIIYGFGKDTLSVWLFKEINGESALYDFCYFESTPRNTRKVHHFPSNSISDEEQNDFYSCISNLLISYLAVKKYAKVETIIVPINEKIIVEDEIKGYKQKEKVKNDSGQEVIIMDSRWFVKIINDNDIFVRGFFRMQRYKDENGEWAKKLIFIDSFIRHGYHRNAKIEEKDSQDDDI